VHPKAPAGMATLRWTHGGEPAVTAYRNLLRGVPIPAKDCTLILQHDPSSLGKALAKFVHQFQAASQGPLQPPTKNLRGPGGWA